MRVSSVLVAVTLGMALSRFGEAVRVFGVLHTLWRRSVTYMTVKPLARAVLALSWSSVVMAAVA